MNDQLASLLRQQGKNLTLLIVCGTVIALVHKDAAIAIFSAVCVAVGGAAITEKWRMQAPESEDPK